MIGLRFPLSRILFISICLATGHSMAQQPTDPPKKEIEPTPPQVLFPQKSAYDIEVQRSEVIKNEQSISKQLDWVKKTLAKYPGTELAKVAEQILSSQAGRVHQLITSQQIDWAKQVIQLAPGTPLAVNATRVLGDYEHLIELDKDQQRIQQRRTDRVQRFWKRRHDEWSAINDRHREHCARSQIVLINPGETSVVYEVQPSNSQWTGPYRLSGQLSAYEGPNDDSRHVQVFLQPVMIRFRINGSLQTRRLETGTYRFVYSDEKNLAVDLVRVKD